MKLTSELFYVNTKYYAINYISMGRVCLGHYVEYLFVLLYALFLFILIVKIENITKNYKIKLKNTSI